MYSIDLPLYVMVTKKKKFYLNLNQYRNAHHHTLNKAKVEFADQVKPLIGHLPKLSGAGIDYELFVPTRASRDVANICSIVDKFFSDVLVSAGILEDDNFSIVPAVRYRYGGLAPNQGRVTAHIQPI